ncbi:hypothetical protein TSAR_003836 [Trichomalopsis sarcophagae]|uniref:Uncharacterized protein n=1 Tax=Trichomalopsis sarcophagae TaxID=543379 RepID=A0A232EY22_9HYME|nr:hypothetical protein TSAR_003836 [Trichomalopsis sarcophagae]
MTLGLRRCPGSLGRVGLLFVGDNFPVGGLLFHGEMPMLLRCAVVADCLAANFRLMICIRVVGFAAAGVGIARWYKRMTRRSGSIVDRAGMSISCRCSGHSAFSTSDDDSVVFGLD